LKIIIGYNKVALLWHENAGTCMHLKRIKSAKTINRPENHWIFYLNFALLMRSLFAGILVVFA
jgi:hypothetical protein